MSTEKTKQPSKFSIGTFEITDIKGYISFTGFVTKDKTIVKSMVMVNIGSFIGSDLCSMSFSSIDIRALSSFLISFHYDKSLTYSKSSGGNTNVKTFSVQLLGEYTKLCMLHRGKNYEVSVLTTNLAALGEELKLLVDETVSNCYLMQRAREKKKREAAKPVVAPVQPPVPADIATLVQELQRVLSTFVVS